MKIKAITSFYDLKAKKQRLVNEEFEVSVTRAKELTTYKNKAGEILCIIAEEPTEEEIKGAENAPA